MQYSVHRTACPFVVASLVIALFTGCDHSAPVDDVQAPFAPVIVDVDPLKNVNASAKAGDAIPDQYVVRFRDDFDNPKSASRQLVNSFGGELLYTYEYALKGFAARMSAQAAESLSRNPNVISVAADGLVSKVADGTQTNPPSWGLDRIDQQNLPLDASYSYEEDGAGVWAYIIDTGIHFDHVEFGAPSGSPRAFLGFDGVGDNQNGWDCDGHGTHVSGTVGGATFGVAKQVNLIAVRVLDCNGNGTWSAVIAGVDYVTNQKQNVLPSDPAVANMSLGGGFNATANAAVQNSIAAGVSYAVAAGNSNADACNTSPASAPDAITAAATTSSDQRWSSSNYGTCTDVFAPGASITSAYHTSASATAVLSGTSMASPHVAGTAAIFLSANPGASPATVTNVILTSATTGVVSDAGTGSPNLLLYSLVLGGSPPPPPPPPPVRIHVESVSQITITGKKRKKGNVVVTVRDSAGTAVQDVLVSGEWTINGAVELSSGTTDAAGEASLSSSNQVGSPTFDFCVTGLSGTNMEDVTDYSGGVCAPYSDPGGDPPPSGNPEQLVLRDASKGVNQKAALDWTGGAPTVLIYRWDADSTPMSTLGPVNNSGSHTDNLGKSSHSSVWYQVCNDGEVADGVQCTAREVVVFGP